jgi:hypothetical protein
MTVNMFPTSQVPTCTTNSCNEPNAAADFKSIWRQQPAPIGSFLDKAPKAPTNPVSPNLITNQPIASFYDKFANGPTNIASSPSPNAHQPIASFYNKPANAPEASAQNNFVAKPDSYQAPTSPDKTAYPSFETADRPDADPYANYGGSNYASDATECAGPEANCGGYDAATVGYPSMGGSYGVSPELAQSLDLENLKTTADVFELGKILQKEGKITPEISETLRKHVDKLISDSLPKFDPNMDYLPTGYDNISVEMMADMGEDISIYTRPPKEMTDGVETPDDITALMLKLQAEGKLTAELTNQLLNLKYSPEFTPEVDPNPLTEERNLEILQQLKSSFGGIPSKNDSSIASMIEKFAEKFPEPGDAASALIELAKAYDTLPRAEGLKHFPSQPLETYFRHAAMKMAELAEKMDKAGKLTPENASAIVDAAATAKSKFGAEPNPEAMDLQLRKLELLISTLSGSGMQSVLMR